MADLIAVGTLKIGIKRDEFCVNRGLGFLRIQLLKLVMRVSPPMDFLHIGLCFLLLRVYFWTRLFGTYYAVDLLICLGQEWLPTHATPAQDHVGQVCWPNNLVKVYV